MEASITIKINLGNYENMELKIADETDQPKKLTTTIKEWARYSLSEIVLEGREPPASGLAWKLQGKK